MVDANVSARHATGLGLAFFGSVTTDLASPGAAAIGWSAPRTATVTAGPSGTSATLPPTTAEINPNSPVYDYAACFSAGPAASPLQPYWASLNERSDAANGKVASSRGKQYEDDQAQYGSMNITLTNRDGALDPGNAESPYAPWVIPYRLFRWRMQWPPTQNLLTQNQAAAGLADVIDAEQVEQPWTVGDAPTGPSFLAGSAPTVIAADSGSFSGDNVYSTAVPSAAAYPLTAYSQRGFSIAPGERYSFSCEARSTTSGAAVLALVQVTWLDVDGAVISVDNGDAVPLNSGSAVAWVPATLTATAPAKACGAHASLVAQSGPATAWTLQSDGWQVEKDQQATQWAMPGTWYPVFTGYIERFPQRWTHSGQYGVSDLTIYDEFVFMAAEDLLPSFIADLLALAPNFLYCLDEATGAVGFNDLTGNRGQALLSAVQTAYTAGGSVASGDNWPQGPDESALALTGAFLGTPGPVLSVAEPVNAILQRLSLPPNSGGLLGPPPSGGWTRLVAARATGISPTNGNQTAWLFSPATGNEVAIFGTGTPLSMTAAIALSVGPVSGSAALAFPGLDALANGSVITDTDWHLYAISLSADGQTVSAWCDSSTTPNTHEFFESINPPQAAPGVNSADSLGVTGVPALSGNDYWIGDLAFACELPFEMTAGTWGNLWSSWRNAHAGESSDARYQRILNWLTFAGPTRLSPGLTAVDYGPATDLNTDPTASRTQGLAALQSVVDTENGQHFIGSDGAAVFQSRGDRYAKDPVVTFGEQGHSDLITVIDNGDDTWTITGSGVTDNGDDTWTIEGLVDNGDDTWGYDSTGNPEIPYTDVQFDFDPTRLANDIQVTDQYTNSLYRAQDGPRSNPGTSQGKYGTVSMQRTVNSISPDELTAASAYLLAEHKDVHERVEPMVIDPSSNPDLWPMVLRLELGMCAAVNRRPPPPAPTVSQTGFLEQIAWSVDGATKKVTVTYQVSARPDDQQYWVMDDSALSVMGSTTVMAY